MDIAVTARHESITDLVREYAADKAGRLYKYFEGLQRVELILGHVGQQAEVEIIVLATRTHRLVQHDRHEDVYAAIDGAVEKMQRQLRRHKEKLKAHRQPSNAQLTRPSSGVNADGEYEATYEDVIEEE